VIKAHNPGSCGMLLVILRQLLEMLFYVLVNQTKIAICLISVLKHNHVVLGVEQLIPNAFEAVAHLCQMIGKVIY
jgi:hypothetical protein